LYKKQAKRKLSFALTFKYTYIIIVYMFIGEKSDLKVYSLVFYMSLVYIKKKYYLLTIIFFFLFFICIVFFFIA